MTTENNSGNFFESENTGVEETRIEVPKSSNSSSDNFDSPQSSKPPKSKLPILIVAIVILIGGIIFALPAIKNQTITKDPATHILYAVANTEKETAISSTVTVSGRIDDGAADVETYFADYSSNPQSLIRYINALADNFAFRFDTNTVTDDTNLFTGDFTAKLQYQDKNFVTLIGSIKPWEIVLESSDLYSKPMYFDINEFTQKEMALDLSSIDVLGYINLLREEDELYKKLLENKEPYQTILIDFLKSRAEKLPGGSINLPQGDSITVYNYKINASNTGYQDIADTYAKIFEIAKNDPNLKAFVLDRTDKIIAKAIQDKDYEKFGATEEEFKTVTADVRKTVDTEYEKVLDQQIEDFRQAQSQLETTMLPFPEITLSIDKEHRIRQIRMMHHIATPDAPPILLSQVFTYNAFGNDVVIAPSLPKDGVNLYELASMPEPPKDMIKEVGTNLTAKILSGEAMEALLKDAQDKKDILPENERDAIANGISQSVDEFKGSISFMLMFMGGDLGVSGTP